MTRKLSPAMLDVLRKMADGWELNYDWTLSFNGSKYFLSSNDRNAPVKMRTVQALFRRGLVQRENHVPRSLSGSPTKILLTPAGRKAVEDED